MCELLVEGTMNINIAAIIQKTVEMLVAMPMLRGSRSHVNDIEPMRANKKPRKVKKTQRE